MTNEQLAKRARTELETYNDTHIVTAHLGPITILNLIGMIQLATRHPGITEFQKEFAKDLVENLSKGFKPEHKAIAELIRRGWMQEHDQELAV